MRKNAEEAVAHREPGKPYRYAGKKWWEKGALPLGDRTGDANERQDEGFENYFSRKYHWAHHGGKLSLLEGDEALLAGTRASRTLLTDPALAELTAVFNRWAQDMTAWATAVREDILAIEGHLGMPHGDPGDPPPVPWK